ncbi:hypothetical protein BV25DRAFT_1824493 [Artomyces pyxidatus]|uniref:Uncharacterized protein n=1 Tax=Artomyces pyxidatus TaxID=48021 RepID=A0ACB8T5I9_9AGAM|nr:hypothetical protein BV25DRAFT_1824493 [Artomyces pyxidatus]
MRGEGETTEGIARHARYQILFKAMMQHDANVIAFGHHADDQVETALMRFKTKILATCEENKLEYVEDKTNFQPELTLRNAIRHMLAQQADTTQAPAVKRIRPPPPTDGGMAGSLKAMVTRSENDNSLVPFDVTGSRQELQGAALAASENLGDVESKGELQPTTILLPAVPDRMVQMAMVLRILRCVSPVPWGSMLSQGGRRTASLVRVVERLWDSDPNSLERKAFEAGGRVLWTPMRICANGRLKYLTPRPGERFGWIASRAPPEHWRHFELRFDLTDTLRRALSRAQQEMRAVDEEILYDHRFLLRLRLQDQEDVVCQALLSGQGRVIVEAETRWFWPRVTLQRPGLDDIVLARVASPEMFWYEHPRQFSDEPPDLPLWHDKMDIQFIRVLDEI